MSVLIFVEDKLCQSYDILAREQLGIPRLDRSKVKAQKIELEEVTTLVGWQALVETAHKTGFDCVVVVIDQEVNWQSPDRPDKLRQVQEAYGQWCRWLDILPPNHQIKQTKVSLVVSQTCLECWLLADTQAVVRFAVGKGKSVPDYRPQQSGRTENTHPREAQQQITRILAEVSRRTGHKSRREHEKSMNQDICKYLDPARAQRNNASLAYFLDQVRCERSGCNNRQNLDQ